MTSLFSEIILLRSALFFQLLLVVLYNIKKIQNVGRSADPTKWVASLLSRMSTIPLIWGNLGTCLRDATEPNGQRTKSVHLPFFGERLMTSQIKIDSRDYERKLKRCILLVDSNSWGLQMSLIHS